MGGRPGARRVTSGAVPNNGRVPFRSPKRKALEGFVEPQSRKSPRTQRRESTSTTSTSLNVSLPAPATSPFRDAWRALRRLSDGMFERLFQSRTRPSLVTDPMALKMDREERRTSRWTDDEHAAFLKAFAATPKNFTAIAAALKGKSRAECVFHYYDCKNQVSYPVLKSKTPPRRRHR